MRDGIGLDWIIQAQEDAMTDKENPDAVPPGTTGAGENICRKCEGSGRAEGKECPECGGTGKVTTGIGGG
ncbi:hypothetical protein GCM10017322_00320 [Paracoccus aerius]|nr:hypothetical protein GCM10017322_00320 [Paracoccus aerius]